MTLLEQIIARAKSSKQRIVLPESLEERTLTAADRALADDLADIILIGAPTDIYALAEKLGLKHIAGQPSSTLPQARRPKPTPSSSTACARTRA